MKFDDSVRTVLAFDPGGVHVGVALWAIDGTWRCAWAQEWTPEQTADEALGWIRMEHFPHDAIAYESFRLRGGAGALAQTGSTFPEVELIGVLRHAARATGAPFVGVEPSQRSATIQRASALGYHWRARGHGGHAKDAEAVGMTALGLRAEEIRSASA